MEELTRARHVAHALIRLVCLMRAVGVSRLLLAGVLVLAVGPDVSHVQAGSGQNIEALFAKACDLYESGDFASAQTSLEAITASGIRSSVVYYNLGNCFYKQGAVGKAVANYRRALLLSPRDEDAQANLDLIRGSVGSGDTTSTYGMVSATAFPVRLVSPKHLQALFYAGYYLASVFFLAVLLLGSRLRRTAVYGLVISGLVAACFFGLSRYSLTRFTSVSEAVVVADRAELKSGPGPAFDEISTLPDGLELRQRARSGIWVEVQLPAGEIGWVREKDVEGI
jgi:hypothetical protein